MMMMMMMMRAVSVEWCLQ